MGFPVDASAKNYSASGTGNNSKFIPEKWSTKLVEKYYEASIYPHIANTDYEGEIKDSGDKVYIRTRPDITVYDYVKGAGLTYEQPESPNVELLIDKGKAFSFKLFRVDEHQADINLMDTWATDGSEQIKNKVDEDILATIPASAGAGNAGLTAGVKSSAINLGVTGTPVALTEQNIIKYIVSCGVVLDEQNRPNTGRWMVLPSLACGLIKTSDLKDASITGDAKSPLRTGAIGMIDRFTIYKSNLVDLAAGEYSIPFGDKGALTFAGQITAMEEVPDPDDFGTLARSLFVYGYEVVDSKGLGSMVATTAFA